MSSASPMAEHTDLEQYRVSDAPELHHLLKTLMDRNVLVHLNGSDGSAYACTLWSIDLERRRVGFSADAHSAIAQRLVEAEEVAAVAYLDRIKVQFDVLDRVLVRSAQSSVLQARIPDEIYRFQRRQAYRVSILERGAPFLQLRHPAIPDMKLALRVLDLSMGGCALLMTGEYPAIEPGARLAGVRLELDADTVIPADLQVHHLTSIHPESGQVRLGCELLNLAPDAQRQLQRYIDQTQKRRRMLSLD